MRTQIVRRAAGAASKQRRPAANSGGLLTARLSLFAAPIIGAPPSESKTPRLYIQGRGVRLRRRTVGLLKSIHGIWRTHGADPDNLRLLRQCAAEGASLAIAPDLCHMSFAVPPITAGAWRRGREAEGDGLLNRYRGNPIVGSNPTVSAKDTCTSEPRLPQDPHS